MSKFKRLSLDEARETFPLLNAEAQQALKGGCDNCPGWIEKGYSVYTQEEYEQMMANDSWGGGAVCGVGYVEGSKESDSYGYDNEQVRQESWDEHWGEHCDNILVQSYCFCGLGSQYGSNDTNWSEMMPSDWIGNMGNTGGGSPIPGVDEASKLARDFILSQLNGTVSKQLFLRYWNSDGDLELNEEIFNDIKTVVQEKNINYVEGMNLVEIGGTYYYKKVVSFYGNDRYEKAFGSATVYFDTDGEMVGFYDYYDFNADADRELIAHLQTLLTSIAGSAHNATPYKISYGIYE